MTGKISGIFAPIATPFIHENVSLKHLKDNMGKYSFGVAGVKYAIKRNPLKYNMSTKTTLCLI